MAKNLKFLLLATLVLFAAFINVAKADDDDDDDDNEREEDLGDGDRDCAKIEGTGFRAIKVTRTTTDGTDSVVFSFRAFPVPRIRVRYFDADIEDSQVEDNDVEEKIEIVAAIPGFFLYNDVDGVAGYSTADTITKRFNLRRANGVAWAVPVVTNEVVDAVQVYKLSVCRKVGDFCFEAFVANSSITYQGYNLTADSIKLNVIANPSSASGLTIADNERLAVVVKLHYESDYEVEDNSEENEELETSGATVTQNDVLIGTDQVSAYFNWEKTVTVTYSDKDAADVNIISSVVTDLDFDKYTSTPGSSDSGSDDEDDDDEEDDDFSETGEETEQEQEEEDDDEEYSDDEEDDAVKDRLENTKILVFAIDGSLATATKIVWDPNAGPTTVLVSSTNAAGSVSMTFIKVLVAAFVVLSIVL